MSPRTSLPWIAISAFFLTYTAHERVACAQLGADAAVRRDLLGQAAAARNANDHARALDLSLRAGRIEMTPSLRMFIAEEEAAVGQLAEALNAAELCVREAEHDPTIRNRQFIVRACEGLVAQMRPRVARVTVDVSTVTPPGFQVWIAGHELNEAFYGIPYIVTPGNVTIDASATGMQPFHREVSIAMGQTVEVPIQLESGRVHTAAVSSSAAPDETTTSSSATPVETASTATRDSVSPSTSPSVPPPPAHRPASAPSAGPYVVAGIGVLAFGASVAFFILRGNAINDLEAQCTGADHTSCPPSARSAFDTANTWNLATDVALGVGGVALATGVAWWIASRVQHSHSGEHATHVGIAPLAEGGAMLQIGGAL